VTRERPRGDGQRPEEEEGVAEVQDHREAALQRLVLRDELEEHEGRADQGLTGDEHRGEDRRATRTMTARHGA